VSTRILAIDPGPEFSAYVLFDGSPSQFGKVANQVLLDDVLLVQSLGDILVIEQIAAMGMAVGAEVFETVFWSGRFAECWDSTGKVWVRVKRHEVKIHLCNSMKAKDANIRAALIDKFGGKDRAIGKKKTPGPLFGISGDCWSALAIAVTYSETRCKAATA